MSTVDLRNKLKEKIDKLDQDYLLEELLSIIELESTKIEVFKIPEAHKVKLEQGLEQMDGGKTTSHTQVIQDLKNGLKS